MRDRYFSIVSTGYLFYDTWTSREYMMCYKTFPVAGCLTPEAALQKLTIIPIHRVIEKSLFLKNQDFLFAGIHYV
jgi:hypothetical protein